MLQHAAGTFVGQPLGGTPTCSLFQLPDWPRPRSRSRFRCIPRRRTRRTRPRRTTPSSRGHPVEHRPPRVRQRGRLARAVVGQPAQGAQPGDDHGGPAATLSSWHPHKAWLNRAALAAVPAPPPAPVAAPVSPRPWPPRPRSRQPGQHVNGDVQRRVGLPGVRHRRRVGRERVGRQPVLGRGRPVPVPAQHLGGPGPLRAAAECLGGRAEPGIPAGVRAVGRRRMVALRRLLTA